MWQIPPGILVPTHTVVIPWLVEAVESKIGGLKDLKDWWDGIWDEKVFVLRAFCRFDIWAKAQSYFSEPNSTK